MSDLISRSAVIDRIAEFIGPKGLDEWEVMVASREIIENVPAVDAVPVVHAKFGFVGPDLSGYCYDTRYGTCSNCKRRIVFVPSQTNFCPNCGAKMDAKEE